VDPEVSNDREVCTFRASSNPSRVKNIKESLQLYVAALFTKQHTDRRTWTQALTDKSKASKVPTYKIIQMHSAMKMRRQFAPKCSLQIPENTAASDTEIANRNFSVALFY
jgi:hypothetical protein